MGQIFGGAGGNNEFESQARSAVIEGAKRRSKLGGSGGMPPPGFFFKIGVKWCILRCPRAIFFFLA